mmetsp:Transcript_122264/g.222405  ORF Transcript_122264/g.222405 Transcript_122264/m.222405 type:complete len:86 (+) Transcript_122264:518-775(+)
MPIISQFVTIIARTMVAWRLAPLPNKVLAELITRMRNAFVYILKAALNLIIICCCAFIPIVAFIPAASAYNTTTPATFLAMIMHA